MHITMISDIKTKSSIFELDFYGQVTALQNPQKFQKGINIIFLCDIRYIDMMRVQFVKIIKPYIF